MSTYSTCAYLSVRNALISMHAFTVLVLLLLPFVVVLFVSAWLFVMLILTYAFIKLVLFDCQMDFDVYNVRRRELVNFYGV